MPLSPCMTNNRSQLSLTLQSAYVPAFADAEGHFGQVTVPFASSFPPAAADRFFCRWSRVLGRFLTNHSHVHDYAYHLIG